MNGLAKPRLSPGFFPALLLSLFAVALMFGPHGTAWENGARGFLLGMLLATPWIVLGFHDLLLPAPPAERRSSV